jgi:peptidoglycan LD-endopeptidase LytH
VRHRRLAAALAAASVLAAGCSGGAAAPQASPTTGSTAAPATTATTATAASTSTVPAGTAPSTTRAAAVRYAFPVRGCKASFSRGHHDYPATDIFAPRGCTVVSPVAGVVDEVSRADHWDAGSDRGQDRGGLSVSVVGADGVRYYGSHLSALTAAAAHGTRVRPGQPLGRVGNTGSARGVDPHLHFGISWPTGPGVWWVRRGIVDPWPFLISWRKGGSLSPAATVLAARRRAGTATPPCSAGC